MDASLYLVFGFVYLGMVLGRIPGLALDRSGVALLGAIVFLAQGRLDTSQLQQAVDLPTLALLFGLMVVSAQLRLGGFYTRLAGRLAAARLAPPSLLLLLVAVAGLLSALLANDIVCLAMTPVLAEGTARRGLDPEPFLLALACAANVGSAATLIGNPQNMLIGQVLHLSFAGYLAQALLPSLGGLILVWAVVAWLYRGRWQGAWRPPAMATQPYDAWQTRKGLLVLVALVLAFLWGPWPREVVALAAAGLLLLSRRMATARTLGLVDWPLLLLFGGLFVVNHCLQTSGAMAHWLGVLEGLGVRPSQPAWLFGLAVGLSNLVSNVPAVMLLLPSASHPQAGAVLALASTLAGNLVLVGSLANLIVADQAARLGLSLGWARHARVGVPVTILSLAWAGLCLWGLGA